MKKTRRHLRLVADQVTQQTCPHWHPELQERQAQTLVVCADCAAIIDSNIPVFQKHG